MRSSILLIGLLFVSIRSHAQFTETDSLYFVAAIEEFQVWLDSTPAAKALRTDGFEYTQNKLTLKLHTASRLDWLSLRSAYYQYCERHIGETFLKKMVFHFEVPLDSINILITADADEYQTLIDCVNGVVGDNDALPIDVNTKGVGAGDYPISEMASFSSAPIIAKNLSVKDIDNLKEQIISYFEGHYKNKEQWWGREAQVEILEIDNEFTIEITNISKEVLDDFSVGYFELIIIDIFIRPNGQNIEIVYNFRAKYGSGIFIAPRRSGYKDINGIYPEYVQRYDRRVRKMIQNVATTKAIKD